MGDTRVNRKHNKETCNICGVVVSVTRQREMYKHHNWSGDKAWKNGTCKGSGKPSVESIEADRKDRERWKGSD